VQWIKLADCKPAIERKQCSEACVSDNSGLRDKGTHRKKQGSNKAIYCALQGKVVIGMRHLVLVSEVLI